MNIHVARNLALAAAVPVLLGSLTACSMVPGSTGTLTVSGSAGPAGVAATTPATGTTPGASPAGATSADKGCKPGGSPVPPQAPSSPTADLDGDGLKDTIWLANSLDTDSRVLGVRTASGAVFSTSFLIWSSDPSGPRARARAYGGRVEGGAVILLAVGDTQRMYAVVGCRIRSTLNAENVRWSFNFDAETDRRSGAGCISEGSTSRVVGYHVEAGASGAGFDVTRSTIRLSDGGRHASVGRTVTLGRSLPEDSSIVQTALSVSCGSDPGVKE